MMVTIDGQLEGDLESPGEGEDLLGRSQEASGLANEVARPRLNVGCTIPWAPVLGVGWATVATCLCFLAVI